MAMTNLARVLFNASGTVSSDGEYYDGTNKGGFSDVSGGNIMRAYAGARTSAVAAPGYSGLFYTSNQVSAKFDKTLLSTTAGDTGGIGGWFRFTDFGGATELSHYASFFKLDTQKFSDGTLDVAGAFRVGVRGNGKLFLGAELSSGPTLSLNTWYYIYWAWKWKTFAQWYMSLYVGALGSPLSLIADGSTFFLGTSGFSRYLDAAYLCNNGAGSTYSWTGRASGIGVYSLGALTDASTIDASIISPVEERHYWGVDPVNGDDVNFGNVTPVLDSNGYPTSFSGSPWRTLSKAALVSSRGHYICTPTTYVKTSDDTAYDTTQSIDQINSDYKAGVFKLNDLHDFVIFNTSDGILYNTTGTATTFSQNPAIFGCGSNFGTRSATLPDGTTISVDLTNVADLQAFREYNKSDFSLTSGKTKTYQIASAGVNSMIFQDRKWMTPAIGVNYAAVATTIENNAGTYYTDPTGTLTYVHPWGDTNPISDGSVYETSPGSAGAAGILLNTSSGGGNYFIKNLALGGTSGQDSNNTDGPVGRYCLSVDGSGLNIVDSCYAYYGSKHHMGTTVPASNSRYLRYKCVYEQAPPFAGSGGSTLEVAYSGVAEVTGVGFAMDSCIIPLGKSAGIYNSTDGGSYFGNTPPNIPQAFYSHNNGAGTQFEKVLINNCYLDGKTSGAPTTDYAMVNTVVRFANNGAGNPATIDRCISLDGWILAQGYSPAAPGYVRDCVVNFANVYQSQTAPTQLSGYFSMTRCTINAYGATVAGSGALFGYFDNPQSPSVDPFTFDFVNCIFLSDSANFSIIGNASASNGAITFDHCIFPTSGVILRAYNDGSTTTNRSLAQIKSLSMDIGNASISEASNNTSVNTTTSLPTRQSTIVNDLGPEYDLTGEFFDIRQTIGAYEFVFSEFITMSIIY